MTGSGLTQAIDAGSRPRALAALSRSFRNIDFAEDLYQDACLKAAAASADILQPAMTMPGVGRMGTIKDPFGASMAFVDYTKA